LIDKNINHHGIKGGSNFNSITLKYKMKNNAIKILANKTQSFTTFTTVLLIG